MQLQEKAQEMVSHYSLTTSEFTEDQGETVEYVFKSDIVIMDEPTVAKVIISTNYNVMHASFELSEMAAKFKDSGAIYGRDILRSMTLSEAIDIFMETEMMSAAEVFNGYREWILEGRREQELSRTEASYLYYETSEIEKEFQAKINAENLGIEDAKWTQAMLSAISEIHALSVNKSMTFDEALGREYFKSMTEDLQANANVIAMFNKVVWQPLQERLVKEARLLTKPKLTIIK